MEARQRCGASRGGAKAEAGRGRRGAKGGRRSRGAKGGSRPSEHDFSRRALAVPCHAKVRRLLEPRQSQRLPELHKRRAREPGERLRARDGNAHVGVSQRPAACAAAAREGGGAGERGDAAGHTHKGLVSAAGAAAAGRARRQRATARRSSARRHHGPLWRDGRQVRCTGAGEDPSQSLGGMATSSTSGEAPALRVPRQPKASSSRPSLLMRCCCCCLITSGRRKFRRFDDEPSQDFRQRMERAQTALDMNERRKSTMPSAIASIPGRERGLSFDALSLPTSSAPPTPMPPTPLAAARGDGADGRIATPATSTSTVTAVATPA